MKQDDQIAAALAWMKREGYGNDDDPRVFEWLEALAADYERQREEVERLRGILKGHAHVANLEMVGGVLRRAQEEIERLKRENVLLLERNSKLAAQQLLDMAKIETLNAEVARATYGRPYD